MIGVDTLHRVGWQQYLLAEDPRPRIDDNMAGSNLLGRLVDLPALPSRASTS